MSVSYTLDDDYDINDFEYGFLTEDTVYSSTIWHMNLPKIMPGVPLGWSTVVSSPFNCNIFVNDEACKPHPSSSLTTQNYVTIEKVGGNFSYEYKINKLPDIIVFGTRFICACINKNPRDLRMTNLE